METVIIPKSTIYLGKFLTFVCSAIATYLTFFVLMLPIIVLFLVFTELTLAAILLCLVVITFLNGLMHFKHVGANFWFTIRFNP